MSPISDACGGGDAGRALVPGALRGYRTWRLLGRRAIAKLPDGALPLTAVTRRKVRWEPTLIARCEPGDLAAPNPPAHPSAGTEPDAEQGTEHRAPQPGCVCGIYGWYDPADTYMTSARIFGVVEASGLVLMGERGFRAERARIVAVVTRNRRAALACEEAGIPAYRRRRDLLRDYPPEDVSSLLGDGSPLEPSVPTPPMPRLHGVDLLAFFAVWVRAVLIAVAFVLLPLVSALVTALAAQVATMGFLFMRLQH